MGKAEYFLQLMACYEVKHALLVGPNSGYATDNRCLLHALQIGQGAFKGIAVVPNDCPLETLQVLKAQGVIGLAFNAALMGFDFYAGIEPLLRRLRQLDMWAQFQVDKDLLPRFLPMLSRVDVKVMVDHCAARTCPMGCHRPDFRPCWRWVASSGRWSSSRASPSFLKRVTRLRTCDRMCRRWCAISD